MDELTIKLEGGVYITVRFDRYDGERCQYAYAITCDGETLASGDDLRSGSGDEIDHVGMMAALLGFLSAAIESYPDGENADLFPPRCVEALSTISEIVTMASMELDRVKEGV